MKKININKTEKDDKLIIDVQLQSRRYSKEPSQQFSNSELIQYLKEEGISLSEYELESQPDQVLNSYSTKGLEPNLEGTWIFKKNEKKEEKLNKTKPRTYKKGRTKKSGD